MAKKLDVKHCAGCINDFYNGQNPYGIEECWSRATAKREKYRLISISLPPPDSHIPQRLFPTCYSAKGFVKVTAEALDSRGYWK